MKKRTKQILKKWLMNLKVVFQSAITLSDSFMRRYIEIN